MSKDREPDHQNALVPNGVANDNRPNRQPESPWARQDTDELALASDAPDRRRFPRIVTDLPDRLPVIQAESDLIVAYFGDIIGEIIANDNSER